MALRVDVLNADGRDAPMDYRAGVGAPDPHTHPPVNYWAYAAATGGRFHQRVATITEPCDAVIVLLRRRSGAAVAAIRALKQRGQRVFVSWKETGLHQIEQQTRWWWQRTGVRRALALADGAVAATEASLEHYRRLAPSLALHYIPTPYPVDVPEWDFSIPVEQRQGILVGTREFDVASRRHEEAIRLSAQLALRCRVPLTVMIADGGADRVRAMASGVQLRLIERRLAYPDYLRMMARHRLVLQMDESHVPGQVAGDALLCRIVALGGNGSIERIAFPAYAALSPDRALASAERLLNEESAYRAAVEQSQQTARAQLSFSWARQALSRLTATV